MQVQEPFFQEVVDSVGVGVAIYDDSGAFVYVNDAYAAMLETDPHVLAGVSVWDVNPEFERERFDDYWTSFEDGETRTAETRHEFGAASVPVSVVTTRREIQGTTYHFGTIQDVTESKRRERELEYQRSLLKAQQEATIDGILVVDENDDIVSHNERFTELPGISAVLVEEHDDVPVRQRVAEKMADPQGFLDRMEEIYADRCLTAREEIELADGQVFDRYTAPIVDDEEYYGRLWVFRDITERIERERALERQTERLEQFAEIVSHDLRNPLNVAQARIEMLQSADAVESADEEGHLAAANRALDRMETLIEETLVLASEGERVSDLAPVSLGTIAADGWNHVDTRTATLAVETDQTVRADAARLTQVFENLFRNSVEHAVEHSSTSPRSQTREDAVEHSSTSPPSQAQEDAVPDERWRDASDPADESPVVVTVGSLPDGFYVEDDGQGIPESERDRVFETGVSTSAEGTGFGLAIVREIVEAHDWHIEVTEGTDGGARFEVTGVDVVDG